ncbi:MazG nucleotide pyrophosphohydrolase domain-containing protein [Candidatus Nanosalina sp. VS9-1]|uniref:MazG nucleotide pyrophosphohydrolase domain-containing protein n=1 Tax=Candidatus Nanosalina sp. VS9-1 TaxID=3388566 RepID=UPI0039E1B464
MKEQEKVAEFIQKHELDGTAEFRILDLVSEVGEVAKDATESAGYGERPEKLDVKKDEIGDVFFSLLAVAESLDIDAEEALDEALEKYRSRISEKGSPTSG